MSILECILIDATEGEIKLIMIWSLVLKQRFRAKLSQPEVLLLIKDFSEIVRKLPDNEVIIEVDNDYTANIVCENASLIFLENQEMILLTFLKLKRISL